MKEEAFLTKQSELGGRAARKYFLILEMVVVVLIAGIGYACVWFYCAAPL